MKPLVCVAPDGSLEVWRHVENYEKTEIWKWLWKVEDTWWGEEGGVQATEISACHKKRLKGPEFWGREVLGEL